jgi:hypothetical protein
MATRKSSRRLRAARIVKLPAKDQLGDALGDFSVALALLRTITMAFVRGEEHQAEHFGPQIVSLELALGKFEALYTRLDLAILRVQR